MVSYVRHLALPWLTAAWFIDRNFAMSLSQFQQLNVVRAPLKASAVPCVSSLLSGKTQRIYEILLKAGVDKYESISYSVDPTATTNRA